MVPKMTSQLGSKNLKTALTPSEVKSKPGEGCKRELETTTMNAAAASTEMEKKDGILKSEEIVEAAQSAEGEKHNHKQSLKHGIHSNQ
jgi:hypothetical protein